MSQLNAPALVILHEWVQAESLRRHCYAVADSMKYFAAQNAGADPDLWEAVGLLHDMDYERHPNQEQDPTAGHPFIGVNWLHEHGWSEEICRAILSHAEYSGVARATRARRGVRSRLSVWPTSAPCFASSSAISSKIWKSGAV